MPVRDLRDGAAMAYADQGVGPAVLLVHGWAANAGFFADLARRLSTHHRVLSLTLRGHPGSDAGALPLTIETLADDIVDFTDALGLKSFAALGWSMGAMALWAAAPALGARLTGIVVEDMGPCVTNDPNWPHGVSGYSAADVDTTLDEISADWPAYVARFGPRMFAPAVRDTRPELIAWAIAEMTKAEGAAMASYWRSMAAQDFRASFARVPQRMLVIRGAESQVYPDGATAHIAQAAPRAERVVIEGAGHVPHLEAPDQFFTHVEAFVRGERRSEIKSGGAVP
jgi:pimeloyl-ACP methyl ester carboxylesterase